MSEGEGNDCEVWMGDSAEWSWGLRLGRGEKLVLGSIEEVQEYSLTMDGDMGDERQAQGNI